MPYNPGMIGTNLAHFKITAKLGEGGMGEVYRAEDTRLGREVAIKVLPQAVAGDPERLARFQREARVLASLNHPHIAGIHQVEQHGDLHFLVMELVGGQDLQQRIARGPIPVAEALPLAVQIVGAIEAAHAQGVIHRDLKPANVMIDPDGQIKVLDFGLAKALDPATMSGEQAAGLTHSPTLTAQMTQAGMILGTASYMSPEQARGEDVDKRCDIWAFGLLLFEMLSGRRTFEGKTVTDIIAAIVTRDPDWELLPANIPAQVRRLLVRCTRKEKRERLHDIADARLDLTEAIDDPEPVVGAGAGAGVGNTAVGSRIGWLAVALAAVGGLVAGAFLWRTLIPADEAAGAISEPTFLSLEVGRGLETRDLGISRDGRLIWYTVNEEGVGSAIETRQLWIRALDEPAPRRLEEANGSSWAVFSPDNRWIAFRHRTSAQRPWRISKMSTDGGTPIVLLADAPTFWDMTPIWTDEDRLLIDLGGDLSAVSTIDGTVETLVTADEISREGPNVLLGITPLPDPDKVLIAVGYIAQGGYLPKTEVFTLSTGARRLLLETQGSLAITDDALIAYSPEATLAFPFDPELAEVTGGAVPIGPGLFEVGLSRNATFIKAGGSWSQALPVQWRRETTGFDELLGSPDDANVLRWSPDGKRIAVVLEEGRLKPRLFTYEPDNGALTRLSFPDALIDEIVWSPDGTQLAFSAIVGTGKERIYARSARGDDTPRILVDEEGEHWDEPSDWSPDGSTIVFNRHIDADSDLMLLDVASGEVRPLFATDAFEHSATFSPDGRWIAYQSDEPGRNEVYLTPVTGPASGGRRPTFRVSPNGGGNPVWAPDGKTLYYVSAEKQLTEVACSPLPDGSAMTFGERNEILDMASASLHTGFQDYAVNPETGAIAFIQTRADPQASRNIQVVLGFDVHVRRVLAGGGR